MRSDLMKSGPARMPHRSLLKAMGLTDSEIKKPFVAVVSAESEYVAGHMHLGLLADAVKAGIRNAGGVPFEFHTIGVCDPRGNEILLGVPGTDRGQHRSYADRPSPGRHCVYS